MIRISIILIFSVVILFGLMIGILFFVLVVTRFVVSVMALFVVGVVILFFVFVESEFSALRISRVRRLRESVTIFFTFRRLILERRRLENLRFNSIFVCEMSLLFVVR